MKTIILDILRGIARNIVIFIILFIILLFTLYSLVDYNKKRERYYRIEFPNGRVYWGEDLETLPGGVRFKNITTDGTVTLYGTYSIEPPTNK